MRFQYFAHVRGKGSAYATPQIKTPALLEHRLQAAEVPESVKPVIGAHAAGADASPERQVYLRNIHVFIDVQQQGWRGFQSVG